MAGAVRTAARVHRHHVSVEGHIGVPDPVPVPEAEGAVDVPHQERAAEEPLDELLAPGRHADQVLLRRDGHRAGALRRHLSLRDLVVYGLLFIGPLAPVGVFGVLDARRLLETGLAMPPAAEPPSPMTCLLVP